MAHVVLVADHFVGIAALDANIVADIADMGQVRRHTVRHIIEDG